MLLPASDFHDELKDSGENELVFAQFLENKRYPDLAPLVRNGRILHRFEFCCRYDLADWEGFLGLFQGLLRAMDVDGELEWDAWKEKTMNEYKDDVQLKELMDRCATIPN
ncbi:uncharacterized protein EURHEDRAFT_416698 [Aspergillus ruber CBS 135680]|uniref:Uncharacterized protein n=1 Tax=Aspergillus ruber (strain CBS 135680) TaxID=1388766 RepID=A0A017S332_ASPRC|nr:uncharacterized protein EURHEDRAFT_416698 [Aspergillus ruber CBS 135680]EYE91251.1 hypothetical protein EURHEDRAFT_416698 [Aspergillus ruber CBS 135680]